MRVASVLALGVAVALGAGCTTGDYRRIPLTNDLGAGDVAHFHALAGKESKTGGSKTVEDFSLGLPLWPAICGSRETTVDRSEGGGTFIHVEDTWGVGLYLLGSAATTSNFDNDGRVSDWSSVSKLLLGLVSSSRGGRRTEHGWTRQSGFGLLWGFLLQTSSDDGHSSWRILMIPFGG